MEAIFVPKTIESLLEDDTNVQSTGTLSKKYPLIESYLKDVLKLWK